MHKSVLIALDSRDRAVKASFDASNAHNEFDRCFAVQQVQADVPDLLPWVRGPLSTVATHEHVGMDGTRAELKKTRGGDQGDAVTALVFPLTYKPVTVSVSTAIAEVDQHGHVYTYQDDMEGVCSVEAVVRANAAYCSACAHAGLRAKLGKMKLTLGRAVPVTVIASGPEVDKRFIVLRHGDGMAVPAVPSASHSEGS